MVKSATHLEFVLENGARVLPLELVPVPVPEHGAQICVGASTKNYVQTGTRAWVPGTGYKH